MLKRVFRWLLYRVVEGLFYFFLAMFKGLPDPVHRKIAGPLLALLIFAVIPRRRIVKNLSAAFGRIYSDSTKKGLARGVQEHFAKNLLDCFLQIADAEHARRIAGIQGLEHLDNALKRGRGVIALGAHIGNFVLLGTRMGMEGYSFHTLFRIPPDARIKNVILGYLPYFHQTVIPSLPKRNAVKQILNALRKNEIVFILGDNLKKGKVDALLFGQRVPSPRGPVSLALRSQAPLVPMYLVRSYSGALELVIEPEIALARNGDISDAIEENTQRVVVYLESLIRRYPDQWNWLTVRMRSFQEPTASIPSV